MDGSETGNIFRRFACSHETYEYVTIQRTRQILHAPVFVRLTSVQKHVGKVYSHFTLRPFETHRTLKSHFVCSLAKHNIKQILRRETLENVLRGNGYLV